MHFTDEGTTVAANQAPADGWTDRIPDLLAYGNYFEAAMVCDCLRALTRLGVPEALAAGPLTVDRLARVVDADHGALRRVLRLLAAHEIVSELDGDRVALTRRGELLCPNGTVSLWSSLATSGSLDVGHALDQSIRTGGSAFAALHGTDFWSWLGAHPEDGELFARSMESMNDIFRQMVTHLLHVPRGSTVADIGGGTGGVLAAILAADPTARGVLVEQPDVLARAPKILAEHGVVDRCELVAGDLFDPPPPVDCYILSRILHDWSDDQAVMILRAIRRSASPTAQLRVAEMIMPDGPGRHPAKVSDVSMLALFGGGRERTLTEFTALLDAGGWHHTEVMWSWVATAVLFAVPAAAQ